MKENLLLLKDLLEPLRRKYTNIWLPHQKMCISINYMIVNKYNNTYNRPIKVKPINVKSSAYIDFGVEKNDKELKFATGNHIRISKYNNIFMKHRTPNCSEVFVI